MAGMASNKFEAEDTVAFLRQDGSLRLGVVSEVFEHIESDSSDSESSFEDNEDEFGKLQPGQTRVEWYPNGKAKTYAEDKLVLVDRALLLGETVCRRSEPNRVGSVTDVNVRADILLLPKRESILTNVDVRQRAQFLSDFNASSEDETRILFDNWIGSVVDCMCRLTLRSTSTKGYMCTITDREEVSFESKDVWPSVSVCEGSTFDCDQWYPKQTVLVTYKALRSATWMPNPTLPWRFYKRFDSPNHFDDVMRFIVEDVHLEQIQVSWLMCLSPSKDMPFSGTKPPTILKTKQTLDKIVKLDHFNYQSTQIGDRVFLNFDKHDQLVGKSEWQKKLAKCIKDGVALLPPNIPCSCHSTVAQQDEHNNSMKKKDCNDLSVEDDEPYFTASESGSVVEEENARSVEMNSEKKKQVLKESVGSTRNRSASSSTSRPRKTLAVRGGPGRRKCPARRGRQSVESRQKTLQTANGAEKRLKHGERLVGEVAFVQSTLQVLWLDGTSESEIGATELTFCDLDLDQHDFFPGSVVSLKEEQTTADSSQCKLAVVTKVDIEQRLATIHWYEYLPENKPLFVKTESISLFDIKTNEAYRCISPGVLVARVGGRHTQEQNLLANVGQVKAMLPEEFLQLVKWFDGSEELVWPTEITAILTDVGGDDSTDSDDNSIIGDDSILLEAKNESSWESVSSEDADGEAFEEISDILGHLTDQINSLVEDDATGNNNNNNNNSPEVKQLMEQLTKQEKELIRLKTKRDKLVAKRDRLVECNSFLQKPDLSSTTPTQERNCTVEDGEENERGIDELMEVDGPLLAGSSVFWGHQKETACAISSETGMAGDMKTILGSGQLEWMCQCPADHQYVNQSFDALSTSRHFKRAVRDELKLLGGSLPPGIFIKAYENRMDLFSCMIVGPEGTPFVNSLFTFDIRLPAQYPTEPPLVFYRSYSSDQLNPNLYLDGKVCVSLLGTWTGKNSECWNPGSNLLQVFLSIQGLILNSEPYFNEAGYEMRREQKDCLEKSRRYNEMALLRSLENLTRTAHAPPLSFHHQVTAHLCHNAKRLMDQTERWLNEIEPCPFPLQPVSHGCKLSAKRQLEKLYAVLNKYQSD